jgi:flavin reductase
MATAPGAPEGAIEPAGAASPEAFKAAFRRLASGVCVVMFRRHGRPHGFTATSVTSVSMAPPKALFCVGTTNDSHPHLSVGTLVGISMLSAAQRSLSDRFAGKAGPHGYDDVETVEGPGGTLLLPGALAHLSARVAERVPAGDHSIIVCDLAAAMLAEEAPPLLHFSRAYHALAPLVAATEPIVQAGGLKSDGTKADGAKSDGTKSDGGAARREPALMRP